MSLKKEETKHIAGLARIGVNEEEVEEFSKDLSAVLEWVSELEEVDVENVHPTGHITGLENVSREDKDREFENKKGIIELFPEERNGYDKVKSVL
jgi:aspartyl-tRNA(Asn)/glutamyl-tRNA(Gln) amidotransferase subunit C